MTIAEAMDEPEDRGFFGALPTLTDTADTFDSANYRPAPDDWWLVVTDVENSTSAIAEGRHKTINFVAATAIAALKNLCAPTSIPFLFGGDGAVVLVPADRAVEARRMLARLRGFAAREFGLMLRVGIVAVGDLRRFATDVRVARYEPSPGNSFGVFLGGGVGMLDAALKGRGISELAEVAAIDGSLDDGEVVDLSGLSCRWDDLRSSRGKMVTLIIDRAKDLGAVYAQVTRIATEGDDPRPARLETIAEHWPPKGLMLEARARRGRRPLALAAVQVLAETALARMVFARDRPIGRFDPQRYRQELVANTDFCKHDETLSFVIDCPTARVEAVRSYLDERAAQGDLRYGMHLSNTALMTCLVTSPTDSLHVHFIDGGDGGYTIAAKDLKGVRAAETVDPAATG